MDAIKQRSSIYFPGLNGLRFIAAFIVIICHIEQQKFNFKLPNLFHINFFHNAAGMGVTLFFVLSGFLITYLLLAEKQQKQTIKLKSFYIRRILRIWPLYFLIVLLGIFLWPEFKWFHTANTDSIFDANFSVKLLLYVLILPNVVHILKWDIPHVGQTWSIGVEEQFYLLWPVIFKFFRNVIPWLILFIALIVIGSNGLYYIHNQNFFGFSVPSFIQKVVYFSAHYLNYFRISCMAIGALGAYAFFYQKQNILKFIYNKAVQIISITALLSLMLLGVVVPYINHEFYSILFIVVVLNISTNKHSLLKLENRLFDYLGKISYGIYMFHGAMITLSINVLQELFELKFESWQDNILLYTSVLLITILLSYLSYEIFEKRFLHFKEKFTIIKSNRSANRSNKPCHINNVETLLKEEDAKV